MKKRIFMAAFAMAFMFLLTACGIKAVPTATQKPVENITTEPVTDAMSDPAPNESDMPQRDMERYGTPVLGFMDLPKMKTFGNYESDVVPTQPGGRSEYSMYTYPADEARPSDALLVKMERYYSTNDLKSEVEMLAQFETYEGSFESAVINDTVVNNIDAKVAIYESAQKDMGLCLTGDNMYRYIWVDHANSACFMVQFIWNPSYHDYDVSRFMATYSPTDGNDPGEDDTSPTADRATGTFTELVVDIPVEADVDADGNLDTVCITVTYDELGDVDAISIVTNGTAYPVLAENGNEYEYMFQSSHLYQAPDGTYGVLVGVRSPFMSAGELWLFRYEGAQPVMHSGLDGTVVGTAGDTLLVETTTLTFGSWYADCEYVVTPEFRLALKDGTMYMNLSYSADGVDIIKPVMEIKVDWLENGQWQPGVLLPGEEITPVATDAVQYFYFTDAQGREGRIEFEGTGYEVGSNGTYPDKMFEWLPYYEG